jgi:uncharacterized protein YraI
MKKTFFLFSFLIGAMLLASCSLPIGFSSTPTMQPTFLLPPPTETVIIPTSTPEPTLTPTITPTATLPVYTQIKITVGVDVLNMREGPSSVFNIVQKLPKDTVLWVLGRAKGDDWLLVRDDGNHVGWVSTEFVQLNSPLSRIPFFDIPGANIIKGKVVDKQQHPIPDINLAVTQGMQPNQVRMDVYSDSEGKFYAYLPETASGPWTVEIVGIMCTSPIMDANCKYSGHFATNAFTIIVPDDVAIPLVFEYTP